MWRFGATFSEQGAIAKHESGVRFRRELIKGFFSVLELGGDADSRRRAAALTPAQGRQLAPCSIVQVRTHMPSLIVLRMAPWSRSKRRARYSALDTARTVVRAHMHCSCGRAQVLHALHGMCDSAPSMTVLASLARDELVRQRSALDAAAADDMSENIDASSEEAPSSPLRHTRKKGRGDNDPAQSSPQEWRINSGSPAAFSPSLEPTTYASTPSLSNTPMTRLADFRMPVGLPAASVTTGRSTESWCATGPMDTLVYDTQLLAAGCV